MSTENEKPCPNQNCVGGYIPIRKLGDNAYFDKMCPNCKGRGTIPISAEAEVSSSAKAQASDDIAARSWTSEDYQLENGKYLNECCHCHRNFWGHKRRVSCRECVEAANRPLATYEVSTGEVMPDEATHASHNSPQFQPTGEASQTTIEGIYAVAVQNARGEAYKRHSAGLEAVASHATAELREENERLQLTLGYFEDIARRSALRQHEIGDVLESLNDGQTILEKRFAAKDAEIAALKAEILELENERNEAFGHRDLVLIEAQGLGKENVALKADAERLAEDLKITEEAMIQYEIHVDSPAPQKHLDMMCKIRQDLAAHEALKKGEA